MFNLRTGDRWIVAIFAVLFSFSSWAAEEDASEGNGENGKEKEEELKTLEDTVKDFEKMEGLFALYRDPEKGELMMEIEDDQLDREYVYFSYAENGVVAANAFRGAYRDQAIFRLRKYFNRIEFIEENTHFYFDPENPLSKAAAANISPAVLATSKIIATSEDEDSYLIKVDDVFLKEALHKVSPTPDPDEKPHERFSLGKLAKDKTRYRDVRVYPENINIQVDYVYENDTPYKRGGAEVTDPRAVTLTFQHSLIAIPENDFVPRIDDPRIGYFFDQVTDLTSHDVTPYRDLINRWHLVKKDPDAAISEPVEPIVWWIENTTPRAYRDAIRDGVLAWNLAFEKAGFKNAIVVKLQPDDADWDAGDIRYNVLRWTSSPQPPFGGYGPSFTNPRTGQILGADIMLEDVYVSNRVRYTRIFEGAESSPVVVDGQLGKAACSFSARLSEDLAFARTAIVALRDPSDLSEMVTQALYELALHEVGHTLGLNHNMRASQLVSNDDIHNATKTNGILIGSVMDYAPTNIAPPGVEQGDYYTTKPGPYDDWAIQFGYDPDLEGENRAVHLARSNERQLAFGNDADDMRSAGKAIDPRVMVDDMSSDAIAYAEDRFQLVDSLLADVKDKLTVPGDNWEEIRNAYMVLTGQQQRQARAVSRYIGGVYVARAVAGTGDVPPYQPVPEERQRRAMSVLGEFIFAPDAFSVSEDLLQHLALQRRGFSFFGRTEDPKIHSRALKIQTDILDHLLHPVVLARITDSGLYGNSYDVNSVLSDLTGAVFESDLKDDVNSFRQALQTEYTRRLLNVAKDSGKNEYDYSARAAAFSELERIESWMKKYRRSGDSARTESARNYVLYLIEQGLDREA
jgi:hypothetical protein